MEGIILEAKARVAGKAASREARAADEIPCVLYGHGVDSQSFQVPVLGLKALIHTNEFHRVSISVDGET